MISNKDIEKAAIRHINLSGDMYSRLVYGEENSLEKYEFQKQVYTEENKVLQWLHKIGLSKPNLIEPRFRKLKKNQMYIYIVSLWGDVTVRKAILETLYTMRKKHKKMLIIGYWSDPAFDLQVFNGYDFDLLVTSQKGHEKRWKNVDFLHVPVASLGFIGKKFPKKNDCFSVGTYSQTRLRKIINSERQFRKQGINSFYCIAGMPASVNKTKAIKEIREYRQFPDVNFLNPDNTLEMCCSANVLLNISRLSESYETNPSYYAVMFNKKLLIDTDTIKETQYYNPKYMKIVDFTQENWLTPELSAWIKKVEKVDYHYSGEWEPAVFYRNIRELIMERKYEL